MEFYEYIIDANERYEDWMEASVFSTELFSKEEFEEIVEKAIKNTEAEKCRVNCFSVATRIIKYDDKFFTPHTKHIAIVKNDGSFEGVI